MQNIKGRRG